MKKRYSVLFFIAIVTTVAIVFSACKKLNEATELGGDLIPAVDNINTFDTTLTVQAFNDTFGLANDSLRLLYSEEHFLGKISNDPIFGTTDAKLFLELKPTTFPFYFANKDNLSIDSVVMVLSYVQTYGDSTVPQSVNVYEMDQSNNFTKDSVYLVRTNNFTYSNLLGSRTFLPSTLDDSVKALKDTSVAQLRIKLNNSFGTRLLGYDSSTSTVTGGYRSDSAFRTKFKGFALESTAGNAVMGFDLSAANTKLAIYYRFPKTGGGGDTLAQAYFLLNTDNTYNNGGATANLVKRNYAGTPVEAAAGGGATPDPFIYLQNAPGTFATLKIPALSTLTNRVIHRAELIVEQQYDVSDDKFPPPDYLYLDAADPSITAITKFRTIPYDLQFDASGNPNFGVFGINPVNAIDGGGKTVKTWHFNISRYVQHVLTGTVPSYDLRLTAPFVINDQYAIPPTADVVRTLLINPAFVKGRVRLAGNTGPADLNPHRIRLRLVYSKL